MSETGKKIAFDLYSIQMKWVAWYLPIVYIAYFALVWFLNEPEIQSMSLLTFTFHTATIFMLVCGILSSTVFLPVFVKHGVSRKSYFQGSFFSAISLAITIIGVTAILSGGLSLFETNIFKDVVLSSLGPNSWLLTSITYFISVMIYYSVGWLIGTAFYRYGGPGGFISIVVALITVSLNDLLWEFGTPKPFMGLLNVSFPAPHVAISLAVSIVIATISIVSVYKIVKDTPIKVV
ncbi:hypothetical protein [Salimicrobium album]|uniref:ABC transporter permease n=1 Tax=Salimicrobium album TaxID=50717 RepID=A0A1H3IPG8_9BACI|nr:hypothetical protein [Salimicrobium album]SDY28724.1 hypothetical protein SAMN04488081_2556 [Salimicrobium album]